MIQNPSMRMDNLFYSLKELQNVTSKYSHIQEKHMRMSETLAVAQQKVEQSMKTFMSLQAEIERNRPKVREAKEEIESERNAQCQLL
ncbi:uncharacterized protein LOC101856206 isoform X2 [Aplysia californica]|uniref:Uncharacterized protein LOC101856206 isoform X2 n=1 Tax=Aplysia californica TaxID=6500 RepID=A0ABM1A775_APLCA|nr:uncharacterized protein LOC101856206 isoform X2 [Aplysia californica]